MSVLFFEENVLGFRKCFEDTSQGMKEAIACAQERARLFAKHSDWAKREIETLAIDRMQGGHEPREVWHWGDESDHDDHDDDDDDDDGDDAKDKDDEDTTDNEDSNDTSNAETDEKNDIKTAI